MLRVGVDNYCLYPFSFPPMEMLKWAADHGADGVQFSGLSREQSKNVDRAYLRDLGALAKDLDLYLEWGGAQHIPRDMEQWTKKDLFEINRKAAEEAEILGVRVVRSCSGGLMRWNPGSPRTETLLRETAACLRDQRSMLRDHQVLLSIETHFEFTTHELLRLFQLCDAQPGDYLGICLDTMNLLIMLEDPVSATERVLPWITSTHIKDGALHLAPEGLIAFPTAIGEGQVDLKKIIQSLEGQADEIHLTVEDHGGTFPLPVFDPRFLSEFPDLTVQELTQLIRIVQRAEAVGQKKNHGMIEREAWPAVCEARVEQDIRMLKRISGAS